MSSAAGELVTTTFEYDGGRRVTVYVDVMAPFRRPLDVVELLPEPA